MNHWKTTALAAALLSLTLTACTTTKAPETTGPSAAEQQAAADRAAAEAAAKAQADAAAKAKADADAARTAAATEAARLESQKLADAQAEAAARANELAASLGMKTFYFGYDDANLQDDALNALKAHALYLGKNNGARVQVNGHADERGTREYNMALAERRAKAVAAFLTGNGASASQLEVVSYGEEKPAVTGEGEESWAKNRRVELEYTAGNP
jgi:peptidoglycan-associated lipoprotein